MTTRRFAIWIGALLAAGAVSACEPAPPRTLTVADPAPLVDGGQVTVEGTGFRPGSEIKVWQCAAEPVGMVDCDLDTEVVVEVGEDGSFTASPTVFAILRGWGRPGVDCRTAAGACVLTADLSYDLAVWPRVTVPLSFDPSAPLLPDPALDADATGLVDGQELVIDGQGFGRADGTRLRGPAPVVIHQCGIVDELLGCTGAPIATVPVDELDGGGDFEQSVTARALFISEYGGIDCRTASEPCFLLATRGRSLYDGVRLDLGFDPDAPLEPRPTPTISVARTEGLHDFESMEVRGTGFAPVAPVDVRVCRADDVLQCDHRGQETPAADEDGALVTEISVWSSWDSYAGDHTDCRQPPGCVVAATPMGSDEHVTVPLSFGPPDPARGRYLDPVFAEVDAVHDVVYRDTIDSQGRPIQLKMDIFRPRGDTETNRPAIVWMHGGFFVAGDKSNMHQDAIAAAQRGYVGISLQYRLRPQAHGWRDMYQASLDAYDDATVGVFWLKVHAAEYGINPDAIIAGGFSAGAVTALNLAYLPGERGPLEPLIAAAVPRGGILYTPPAQGEVPTIAFHGSLDQTTDLVNVGDVCDLAADVDIACELVIYDGSTHTQGDLDDVMRRTTDFLAEHVLPGLGYDVG